MLSTYALEAQLSQLEKRREKERNRQAELIAHRPKWAEMVADEPRMRDVLADATAKRDAENERHEAALAELDPVIDSHTRALRDLGKYKRLLVETAPEFLSRELQWVLSKLDAAELVTREQEPQPPTILAGFNLTARELANFNPPPGATRLGDVEESRAYYAKLVADWRERVARAHATIQKLEPVAAELRALAMNPAPTLAQVAEICPATPWSHKGETPAAATGVRLLRRSLHPAKPATVIVR